MRDIINEEMAVTRVAGSYPGVRPVMLSEITGGQYSHIRVQSEQRGRHGASTGACYDQVSVET